MNAIEADNNNEIESAIQSLESAKIGNKYNWTLLQLAIRFNCEKVMLHLLNGDADPEYAAENTLNPTMLAIEYHRHTLMAKLQQVIHMKAIYQKKEKDFQSMLDKLSHQNELTQPSQSHMLIDEQMLEKLIIALTMEDQLSKLTTDSGSYASYKQSIIDATSSTNSISLLHTKVYLSGANIEHRCLRSEPAQLLLSHTDKSGKSAKTYVVKVFEGIHFKANPHAPGVEFMVNSLVNLIAGYSASPTKLLKIYQNQQSLTYLASKTAEGITLDFILQKYPELITKIDDHNFSSMFLLGLLINPQNGKADNYTVKFSLDQDSHIDKLYIIGVDNDIAFADSIIKLQSGKHHINVRNILYFLPQMQAHFDDQFRQEFLKLSAEIIVIKWLESLAHKNNEYKVLQKQKIFDSDELEQYQLPIRLAPNLVNTLYQRIKSIQDLLTCYPNITHEQMFQKIDPILYEYYKKIQDRSTDPMDAICKFYIELSPIEETINPHSLFYPKKLMTRLAYEMASASTVEEQDMIPIIEAMESFISSINFSVLSEAEQLHILGYLSGMEHTSNLEIHGCSVLDHPLLMHMLDNRTNRRVTFTFYNMQSSPFTLLR